MSASRPVARPDFSSFRPRARWRRTDARQRSSGAACARRDRHDARRHRLDVPTARVWHRDVLAGPSPSAARGRGRVGCRPRCDRSRRRARSGGRSGRASTPGPAGANTPQRPACSSAGAMTWSSSNTSTASSAGTRARTSCRSPSAAAPADGPHAAHGPVGAVGAAGRDVARPVRHGRARLRLHRDGPQDDPRRTSGVARARARRSARWPDRAPSRCSRKQRDRTPATPGGQRGFDPDRAPTVASWRRSASSPRARASRSPSQRCRRSSRDIRTRCT